MKQNEAKNKENAASEAFRQQVQNRTLVVLGDANIGLAGAWQPDSIPAWVLKAEGQQHVLLRQKSGGKGSIWHPETLKVALQECSASLVLKKSSLPGQSFSVDQAFESVKVRNRWAGTHS
jgi:hypothetical protein